jgi:hypothetical protein
MSVCVLWERVSVEREAAVEREEKALFCTTMKKNKNLGATPPLEASMNEF